MIRLFYIFIAAFIFFPAPAEEGKFAPVKTHLQTCVACHGPAGKSVVSIYPHLAGQHFYYVYTQLKDLKSGLRSNPVMSPLASVLKKEDMQLIAEYYSRQSWPKTNSKATKEQIILAKKVIDSGQCVACHLGGFEGNSRVPRLAGQHATYLETTMLDFKNKVRNNSPSKSALLATFSEAEIKAVAAYLSGLK